MLHTPVLFNETLDALALTPGATVVDATVGAGGHAAGILERTAPNGLLLGIERDPENATRARARLTPYGKRATIAVDRFSRIVAIVQNHLPDTPIKGILFDVGLSSMHIDVSGRGFSFHDVPDTVLDMRMDHTGRTASDLLMTLSPQELADMFSEYGGETHAGPIAAKIVSLRHKNKTFTVGQLNDIVLRVYRQRTSGKRHPATKVYQALRIAVNDELTELSTALPQAIALLAPEGRIACITFHSLEHRIVKRVFREAAKDCVCPPELPVCRCDARATLRILTPKAVTPSHEEQNHNPRARSAQLRVAMKINTDVKIQNQ